MLPRSAFIEAVLTRYLRKRARAQVEARDLELINKAANELNAEVEDILRYQDSAAEAAAEAEIETAVSPQGATAPLRGVPGSLQS
jgi:hypothetical protein